MADLTPLERAVVDAVMEYGDCPCRGHLTMIEDARLALIAARRPASELERIDNAAEQALIENNQGLTRAVSERLQIIRKEVRRAREGGDG